MVSLVDIGKLRGTATIRGEEVDITGIKAKNIVNIFFKFPEVRMILTQVKPDAEVITTMVARFPDAVACIIAAACGAPDDEKFIEAAGELTIGEQYAVLQKIGEITFPQGMQNFLDGVQKLLKQADGGLGWAPATMSPAPSNAASPQEEPSETAGTQPQDS